MSHLKERKKTNCLNCNAEVNGKYCSVCGQENIEPAESVGHLVMHFFNDITHFDGKFFSSLKYLIFKPGFLSTQYRIGRRASYLNPIRMYVFTSFIFFLIFFSVFHFDNMGGNLSFNNKTEAQIKEMDSISFNTFARGIDSTRQWDRASVAKYIDSTAFISGRISKYKSKEQYDSMLRNGVEKDNWFARKINYRQIELDKKYEGDKKKMTRELVSTFMHTLPQMLFVSLPLFALFLKLLYWRSKQFYYVSHAIFSLHFYIFIFITFLVSIGINKLGKITHMGVFDYLYWALNIFIFFYLYKGMRNFYGQRRGKTILKFILLNFYLLFILMFIFVFFMIFSYLKV